VAVCWVPELLNAVLISAHIVTNTGNIQSWALHLKCVQKVVIQKKKARYLFSVVPKLLFFQEPKPNGCDEFVLQCEIQPILSHASNDVRYLEKGTKNVDPERQRG